jgi:catalase (peroxidase I)
MQRLTLLLLYLHDYSLRAVVAIKQMSGPSIPWKSGRFDALDPSAVTPDGRLPNADSGPPGADKSDADHLRSVFYRMGFNDQEIVALSGARKFVANWKSRLSLFRAKYCH